ncbi:zinc ribbon domain-containing protein [Candidatus Woesearchaeota archaeon]|nr:zinc ribbon domain-containing protein [Candidatus Woesearchaeota archaeon]
MPCQRCNGVIAPNDKFCGLCGAPQPPQPMVSELIEENPADDVLNTCPSCGAGVTDGQMYCTVCGKTTIGED